MPTPSPLRWEPFIAKLEQASERGEADFISQNMPHLEQIIAELMDCPYGLAKLFRARGRADDTKPE